MGAQRPARHRGHEPSRPSPLLTRARRPPPPGQPTRFLYLDPQAPEFFVDYDRIANDAAAMLRLEAGRNPHDKALIGLVGRRWASHDVTFHRSGQKRLRHPVVGRLDLDFEGMELASSPGLYLNVYTAAPGTPTADALKLLASWAASQTEVPTEAVGSAARAGLSRHPR
jgi:hypothetical protein